MRRPLGIGIGLGLGSTGGRGAGTALFGPELVINGTFDTDTTGWTLSGTGSMAAIGGQLVKTSTGVNNLAQQLVATVESGKTYRVMANLIKGTNNTLLFWVGSAAFATADIYNSGTQMADFDVDVEVVATTNNFYLDLVNSGATPGTQIFDNISIREVL